MRCPKNGFLPTSSTYFWSRAAWPLRGTRLLWVMSGQKRHHRWMCVGLDREVKSVDHDGFGKEQFD